MFISVIKDGTKESSKNDVKMEVHTLLCAFPEPIQSRQWYDN